jgi:UDP-2,3-diacylglucosamine pyrophosphatase LpxH
MDRTIIVSDLHVDTWTARKIRATGKTKKEHFFELLDWCEGAKVREFVINGDVMDLPPYEGQSTFCPGPSIARDVVERLIAFAAKVPVAYIYGNHDIGISGYRSMGRQGISWLSSANFIYPNYVIDDYAQATILVEHGHFADPFILLYLRDLADRTYIESKFEAFQWAMQRRDPQKPLVRVEPGVGLAPVGVTPGENAYYAARAGQAPLPKETWLTHVVARLKAWGARKVEKPTMERWWRAAIDGLRQYVAKVESEGKRPKPAVYMIYGHTHRADPRCAPGDAVPLADGVSGYYINAGTWAESVDEGWYIDIDPTGKPWLQDWINEPAELRKL